MNKYSQFQSETLFPVGSQVLNLYIKDLGGGGLSYARETIYGLNEGGFVGDTL